MAPHSRVRVELRLIVSTAVSSTHLASGVHGKNLVTDEVLTGGSADSLEHSPAGDIIRESEGPGFRGSNGFRGPLAGGRVVVGLGDLEPVEIRGEDASTGVRRAASHVLHHRALEVSIHSNAILDEKEGFS